MVRIKNRFVTFLMIVLCVLQLFAVSAYAATTVSVLDGQVSVTGTISGSSLLGSGTTTESNGIVTATAVGGSLSRETNSISITNNTEKAATISFDYVASNYSKFSETVASGSKSIDLGPKETKEEVFSIAGKRGTLGNVTATLSLSNFTYSIAAEKSKLTFDYSGGVVTVGGTLVSSGSSIDISSTDGAALVALPDSGFAFLGWVNGSTNEILSTDTNYTIYPIGDMTVKAAFVSASAKAWFKVGNYYVDDLNLAVTLGSIVIPAYDGTLPAGNYTIPSGVTLLIPCDDANTVCTTAPEKTETKSLAKPTAYRTLTMATGANISVNGAISIPGTQHGEMARGTPFGPVGFIKMASGSSITINNDANLYAWGYITGDGSVTVKSGGSVYECFQISDWRGSSATSAMVKNGEKIFPMTQYYVQNVEVPMTLEAGATEYGHMSVRVSMIGVQTSLIPFVGNNAMFRISSGSITKDYDENTDRLLIDLNDASLSISPYTISIKLALFGSVTLKSSDYVLPITSNLTLNVNSGSSADLSQDVAFLPGSEVNVEEGATCTVSGNSNVYVYDVDEWGTYCGSTNKTLTVIAYAPGQKKTRTEADLVDAAVKVDGTVDATNGYLYTTAGGANVYSEGNGKVIQRVGDKTITYQATYVEDGYTPHEIPITPAKLKNADGTYTNTAEFKPDQGLTSTTYTYEEGAWRPVVAKIGETTYRTLAKAIANYSTGYIQMVNNTNETVSMKDVYLDLNGNNVSVTAKDGTTGTIYGMDSTGNGYETPGGTLTASGVTIATYAQPPDLTDGTKGKYYVANQDSTNVWSFHRFDLGVTECTFYKAADEYALTFTMEFKSDATGYAKIKDLTKGVQLNGTLDWWDANDPGKSEDAVSATLVGTLTTSDPAEKFTVKATMQMSNQTILGEKWFANALSYNEAYSLAYPDA